MGGRPAFSEGGVSDEPDPFLPLLEAEALRRSKPGNNARRFAEDGEIKGLIGEAEFARTFDQPMNWCTDPAGDGGIDFTVPLAFTVDVKCAAIPKYLMHEQGKIVADIYVLGRYLEDSKRCMLLGWETGEKLRAAPVKPFGYGANNHYILAGELRPMSELARRIMRLVAGSRG